MQWISTDCTLWGRSDDLCGCRSARAQHEASPGKLSGLTLRQSLPNFWRDNSTIPIEVVGIQYDRALDATTSRNTWRRKFVVAATSKDRMYLL